MGNFLGYYRNKQLLHKDKMGYSEYVQGGNALKKIPYISGNNTF